MKSLKRRWLTDKIAHCVIMSGGASVIFIIFILFLFIFLEVYPLFKGATVVKEDTYSLRGNTIIAGADEHQEIAYAVYTDGKAEFISLPDGKTLKEYTLTGLNNLSVVQHNSIKGHALFSLPEDKEDISAEKGNQYNTITSAFQDKDHIILGTHDGRALTVSIAFSESFLHEKRTITPEISEENPIQIDEQKQAIKHIISKKNDTTAVMVVTTEDGRLLLRSAEKTTSLFGEGEQKESKKDITDMLKQGDILFESDNSSVSSIKSEDKIEITSLALDHFMDNLYIGTSSGEIFHINIQDKEIPVLQERVRVSNTAVTTLGFLLGDISLVIGDSRGNVGVWMQVRDEHSSTGASLKRIHTLEPHNAPIVAVASSTRDKGFVTASSDGIVHLNYATSERTLLHLNIKPHPAAIAFSPKANGILVTGTRNLFHWWISNPHPEITLKTLFGKVWYEGYEKPEFVWQSTGGTDDFEPKFSLVPLIFGTIKGTLYSLIIAVPIGILAALYTSQFLHKTIKFIKPFIEIMAALPSVILGFLAGLWLAPLIEKIFPAIVTMPLFIVLFIALALLLWKCVPTWLKGKYRYGIETLFLIPFIIGAVYVSIQLSAVSESVLFKGDYRQWILTVLGLQYDQRNALIVGFVMGFAVIPLVFTISEDAMSNVPRNLISASLALGATPWQTAVRVVLPTASPGIFSAIMIGFGRAVGETMIVLMATGNTPIMDWNLFNGFRTLAANIAVEIPEAPVGGSLYRVLFLAALLLFVITFIANTVAETVRQKMRKKYSKL